jgi:hypothetical protein
MIISYGPNCRIVYDRTFTILKLLQYSLSSYKQSSLLGPLVSYKEMKCCKSGP